MKKVISLLVAIVIVGSLVTTAFASDAEAYGFVPSITYKPEPEIVPSKDKDGNDVTGIIRDKDGQEIGYLGLGCLLITPIAHVWDEEKVVPEDVERLLLFVYDGLSSGEMKIPYEKFDAGLNEDDMVIRDLFDARWGCEEHPKMLEPEGVVVEITFDLGIVPEAEIYTMSYDEERDEWDPIVSTVNNGDGTVTCVFEHLCAISFSMPATATEAEPVPAPAPASAGPNVLIWVLILGAAAAAVAVLLVVKNKKKATAKK